MTDKTGANAAQASDKLFNLCQRLAQTDGINSTALPQLKIVRNDHNAQPLSTIHQPMFCYLVEGKKQIEIADKIYRYGRDEFLVSTVDLPITGEIIEASPERPYFCVALEIEPSQIYEILRTLDESPEPEQADARGFYFGGKDKSLSRAVLRLMETLDDSRDRKILSPLYIREIYYRLMGGRQGTALRQLAQIGSPAQRISKAIAVLKADYAKSLKMAELAKVSNMSVSSFNHYFKAITTLSPLQYQKQLRLQEARRLMLQHSMDAASAAFEVGYESPSQFSREYVRLFGLSPLRDIKRLRK